ncbi:MAG: Ppx/GppA phosphatase family protein [Actinomycetota bacterium]|nr:Ppx/GppA phosphatase family protein [Actinomycetota bacterium]
MASVAVLDCGSNSTRLLIVADDATTLQREMRITRLSAGVDASGNLSPEALERSYATLSEYRQMMDAHGVTRGLLVATSAVRDAINGAQFLARAAQITGVEARVLKGTEEAAFSYAGATRGLAPDSRATLIVDIGGGSTELAVSLNGEVRSYSMQLGCVRVTERALGAGVVEPEGTRAAQAMIEAELDRAFEAVPQFRDLVGAARLVGLAGTVATLAQLDAGSSVYDRAAVHLRRLSREDVRSWRERLGALSPAQRLELPGMVRGREDVLVAGLFILEAVMDRFAAHELLSSEDDILDGVAASLL